MLYKTTPRPYQLHILETLLQERRTAWAGHLDPGLGKSKLGLDWAANLYQAGLIDTLWIVAPNNVHRQWIEEQVPAHLPVPASCLVYRAPDWDKVGYQKQVQTWQQAQGFRILAVNLETWALDSGIKRLKTLFKGSRSASTCLLIDEASKIKNPAANRTKSLLDFAHLAGYKACLTGTPVTNSPFDVWSQFEALQKGFWGIPFFGFKHRYGLLVNKSNQGKRYTTLASDKDFAQALAMLKKGHPVEGVAACTGFSESALTYLVNHPGQTSPYRNLEELRARIAPWTFTVRKEDVAQDLPPKTYVSLYTELSPEQAKAYKDLKKSYAAELNGQQLTVETAIVLALRLQQITGGFFPVTDPELGNQKPQAFVSNPKLQVLLEDLEETDGRSILVWAQFRAEIEAIVAGIRETFPAWRVEAYYGGQTATHKKQVEEDFKAGLVNVLVANPKSAGIGLNLQVANLSYIYSEGFSLEERIQKEARTDRIGQTRNVLYKDIYIKGTIDERIYTLLRDRKGTADFFRNVKMEDL